MAQSWRDEIGRRLRAFAEKDGRGYPDWAIRYVPIVRRLRKRGKLDGRILEIGANENGFARFSGRRVVAVDVALDHLKTARSSQPVLPVVADIAALPFADGAFDLCVCVDTFEHLPESLRPRAAASILQILQPSGAAVVTFPSGTDAEAAEAVVREAYKHLTGGTIRWLEEHRDMGLPDPEAIRSHFASTATHTIAMDGNAPIAIWKWVWLVLMCNWPGRGNAVAQVVLRIITPILVRLHGTAYYRSIIWILPNHK